MLYITKAAALDTVTHWSDGEKLTKCIKYMGVDRRGFCDKVAFYILAILCFLSFLNAWKLSGLSSRAIIFSAHSTVVLA